MVLLQSHNAATCIIEHHYVCLDHRSEVSAFYSQLDETVKYSSVRLHFFSKKVTRRDLMSIPNDAYLGYIVMRSSGMPPIVRAMLRPPVGVLTAATEEHVNFFGQKLRIEAVPFMQQDTRYATCAHAAAWMIHYAAFRHGVVERRLISDLVSTGS